MGLPHIGFTRIIMDGKTPVDGAYGLDYQIHILRLMISELPPKVAEPLHGQVDSTITAMQNRFKIVYDTIKNPLDDVRLAVNTLEFDLQATKKERDQLQNELDDLS